MRVYLIAIFYVAIVGCQEHAPIVASQSADQAPEQVNFDVVFEHYENDELRGTETFPVEAPSYDDQTIEVELSLGAEQLPYQEFFQEVLVENLTLIDAVTMLNVSSGSYEFIFLKDGGLLLIRTPYSLADAGIDLGLEDSQMAMSGTLVVGDNGYLAKVTNIGQISPSPTSWDAYYSLVGDGDGGGEANLTDKGGGAAKAAAKAKKVLDAAKNLASRGAKALSESHKAAMDNLKPSNALQGLKPGNAFAGIGLDSLKNLHPYAVFRAFLGLPPKGEQAAGARSLESSRRSAAFDFSKTKAMKTSSGVEVLYTPKIDPKTGKEVGARTTIYNDNPDPASAKRAKDLQGVYRDVKGDSRFPQITYEDSKSLSLHIEGRNAHDFYSTEGKALLTKETKLFEHQRDTIISDLAKVHNLRPRAGERIQLSDFNRVVENGKVRFVFRELGKLEYISSERKSETTVNAFFAKEGKFAETVMKAYREKGQEIPTIFEYMKIQKADSPVLYFNSGILGGFVKATRGENGQHSYQLVDPLTGKVKEGKYDLVINGMNKNEITPHMLIEAELMHRNGFPRHEILLHLEFNRDPAKLETSFIEAQRQEAVRVAQHLASKKEKLTPELFHILQQTSSSEKLVLHSVLLKGFVEVTRSKDGATYDYRMLTHENGTVNNTLAQATTDLKASNLTPQQFMTAEYFHTNGATPAQIEAFISNIPNASPSVGSDSPRSSSGSTSTNSTNSTN